MMGTKNNLYGKENRKIELRIDGIAGDDIAVLEIKNNKDKINMPEDTINIILPKDMAYNLSELLFSRTKKQDRKIYRYKQFLEKKINEYEYLNI